MSRRVTRTGSVPRQNGFAIAVIRDLKHISQAQLARDVGIAQPSLWAIEHEHVSARVTTLTLIAQKLDVPLKAITYYREQETEAEAEPEEAGVAA